MGVRRLARSILFLEFHQSPSAAVAKDKVIMWDVLKGPWNGAAAAAMYNGPFLSALKKTWGKRPHYTIVEDGDRKGNQNTKGINAKASKNIRAIKLPPRTPSWMPLDYAIWIAIEKKMDETAPEGTEKKADYIERLAAAARSLPRGYVKKMRV